MTIEEFINEKLCPAGVVTVWEENVIATAYRLGDMEMLTKRIAGVVIKSENTNCGTSTTFYVHNRRNKHLRLILPFIERLTVQKHGVSALCEIHQYLVLLRAVDTYIGGGAVVGYFVVNAAIRGLL